MSAIARAEPKTLAGPETFSAYALGGLGLVAADQEVARQLSFGDMTRYGGWVRLLALSDDEQYDLVNEIEKLHSGGQPALRGEDASPTDLEKFIATLYVGNLAVVLGVTAGAENRRLTQPQLVAGANKLSVSWFSQNYGTAERAKEAPVYPSDILADYLKPRLRTLRKVPAIETTPPAAERPPLVSKAPPKSPTRKRTKSVAGWSETAAPAPPVAESLSSPLASSPEPEAPVPPPADKPKSPGRKRAASEPRPAPPRTNGHKAPGQNRPVDSRQPESPKGRREPPPLPETFPDLPKRFQNGKMDPREAVRAAGRTSSISKSSLSENLESWRDKKPPPSPEEQLKDWILHGKVSKGIFKTAAVKRAMQQVAGPRLLEDPEALERFKGMQQALQQAPDDLDSIRI